MDKPRLLAGPQGGAYSATCALLRLSPGGVEVEIHRLQNGTLILSGGQAFPPQT